MRLGVAALALCALLLGVNVATSHSAGRGWTRTDLGAVSQPAPAGGRFVVYTHRSGSLKVVALNASDGSTAWSAAAAASHITPGVVATLAVRAGLVFYLAPVPGGAPGVANLVGRDAASGRLVWRSPLGVFLTWPEICPDDLSAVCVNGLVAGGGSGLLRFAAATGRLLGLVKVGNSANYPGRELGPDLFDPGSRNPESLVATSNGRVTWRRALSSLFPFAHASTDGGWDFDRVSRSGLFVGSVGTEPTNRSGVQTINLAVPTTVGFSISTGRVAWRSAGFYSCGQPFPCPGRTEAGYSSPGSLADAGPSIGIRFVERGHATFTPGAGSPKLSPDVSLTIQGFNPASGRTTWSFAAGRDIGLISSQVFPSRLDEDRVVIRDRSGRDISLDLRTGATRRVSKSALVWCQRTIQYQLSNTGYFPGKSGQYVGQAGLYPCTAGGRRAGVPSRIPSFVGQIGATTGGVTSWTDTNAVHGA